MGKAAECPPGDMELNDNAKSYSSQDDDVRPVTADNVSSSNISCSLHSLLNSSTIWITPPGHTPQTTSSGSLHYLDTQDVEVPSNLLCHYPFDNLRNEAFRRLGATDDLFGHHNCWLKTAFLTRHDRMRSPQLSEHS